MKITKRYEVVHVATYNETELRLASANSERSRLLFVRTDLIPSSARVQGRIFSVTGTPLEIELFELSSNRKQGAD